MAANLALSFGGKFYDKGAAALNVRHGDFGAVGDGTTDDLAAFHAAFAALGPASWDWGTDGDAVSGGVVFVPPGVYRLAGNLRINRPMVFAGAGGRGDHPPTRLYFDDGFGIIVDGIGTSSDGSLADWTVIRDMALTSAGNTVANVHGIHAKVRVRVESVLVDSFSGDGILVDGDLLVSEGQTANCWVVSDCRVFSCTGNGLHIVGENANGGNAWANDFTSNEGYGVYDESSLGNTYIGNHFDNNYDGFARVRNSNAFSIIWGGYVESNASFPVRQTGYFVPGVVVGGVEGSPTIAAEPTDATGRVVIPIGQGATIGTGNRRRTITQGTAMPVTAGLNGDHVLNSDYGWAGAGANQWVRWWVNVDGSTTWEAVAKAAAQTDSTATTVTDLRTDFNSLLAKLRAAGVMAA